MPALIVPEAPASVQAPSPLVAGGSRMEVLSANGRRVIVDHDVDVHALLRIMRALETLRSSLSRQAFGCGWRRAILICAAAFRR